MYLLYEAIVGFKILFFCYLIHLLYQVARHFKYVQIFKLLYSHIIFVSFFRYPYP